MNQTKVGRLLLYFATHGSHEHLLAMQHYYLHYETIEPPGRFARTPSDAGFGGFA